MKSGECGDSVYPSLKWRSAGFGHQSDKLPLHLAPPRSLFDPCKVLHGRPSTVLYNTLHAQSSYEQQLGVAIDGRRGVDVRHGGQFASASHHEIGHSKKADGRSWNDCHLHALLVAMTS